MKLYDRYVLPRLTNLACGSKPGFLVAVVCAVVTGVAAFACKRWMGGGRVRMSIEKGNRGSEECGFDRVEKEWERARQVEGGKRE